MACSHPNVEVTEELLQRDTRFCTASFKGDKPISIFVGALHNEQVLHSSGQLLHCLSCGRVWQVEESLLAGQIHPVLLAEDFEVHRELTAEDFDDDD